MVYRQSLSQYSKVVYSVHQYLRVSTLKSLHAVPAVQSSRLSTVQAILRV